MPADPLATPAAPPRRTLSVWLATGLGIGFIPWAPGTFGTLWGVPLGWAIGQWSSPVGQLALIAVLIAVGVPLCTRAVRRLGGQKDPGCVVYDEIASLPVVYWGLDVDSPWVLVAGFALFRLFDIVKPPPAPRLERLPEGWGVMADDVMAAIYAHLVLRLVVWLGWLPLSGG